MTALQAQKKALRKTMATRLRSLSVSDVQQQSGMITDRVLASPYFARSQCVSCYLSMPSGEVDTSSLISAILRSGKTLFVPKIDTTCDGTMDFLQVYGEDDLRAFPPGTWGIKEPAYEWKGARRRSATDDGTDLDLIFLPGVAFDRSMSRLGHGKGYYDRFISSYAASKSAKGQRKPLLVALSLREQILEAGQVPVAPHDWKMDVIAGPDGLLGEAAADSSQ
ncbi:nagb/rpia/CoA transferase-like protein [Fomitopsis serialis]|uniref:nagb/rpia/CoA transferase-like protein n=1 Tax=Fomitopsis serialis TaxID=139415 RepID=UPI0020084689|nr:nagb/rpia/CoA transferase-like protein [Neoantrodia serialis]KAH9933784.1 nagb/rpia/CoA transferase-like protein [Neoantrodia serialis]